MQPDAAELGALRASSDADRPKTGRRGDGASYPLVWSTRSAIAPRRTSRVVNVVGSRGTETGETSLPDPRYWRNPRYWRWWWRDGVSVETVRRPSLLARTLKVVLALLTAGVLVIGGLITADSLSSNDTSETLTVPVVSTVGAATSGDGLSRKGNAAALTPPALRPPARVLTSVRTMFVTTTSPTETKVVTVRRNGRTLVVRKVVRKPSQTVTHRVTVPGPVRERVVTSGRIETVVRTETQTQTRTTDRLVTVTTPAATQTVSRTVTQPSPTVTQTNVVTVHEPAHVVTVTRPVTVTNEVTVTVTETRKK